jgi:hypothetical protein
MTLTLTPAEAFRIAKSRMQPCPELADIIATDAYFSYEYAAEVLGERFPKGEPAIAKTQYAYDYACGIIKGRFPEGEEAISSDAYLACYYALNALGERFLAGEPTIIRNPEFAQIYADAFGLEMIFIEKGK